MFKLVIQDDEGKTTVVPLIRDEITIGRKEGNTIRLTERNVSRRHARILRSNGEVQIEDLGSYNGIRVNNARIAERVNLRVSDQVQIGDYKLYLKAEGVEQVDDARTMPIERIDQGAGPTALDMPAVSAAPTAPLAIPATPTLGNGTGANPALATPPAPTPVVQIQGNPNRTLVAVANTDSEGRPLATPQHIAAAIPQATGYGKLVVLSSNFASKEFELSRPQMIIGRTDENDLVINHRSISRNHAKVVREPDTGHYTISDLQSSNGVRVNGQDYGKVELRRGDVIDLGHVRLRFVEPGEDFVFARDAVITDVPDSGSKKGLLVAIVLGILVLGGVLVFFLTREGDKGAGGGTGPGTGSQGVVETPDANRDPIALADAPDVAPPTDAAIVVQPGNADQEKIALECKTAITDKDWSKLSDCGKRLTKAGGEGQAFVDQSSSESKAEVALRNLKPLLKKDAKPGDFKEAVKQLAAIPTTSVYYKEAKDLFDGVRNDLVQSTVADLNTLSKDCVKYNNKIKTVENSYGKGIVDEARKTAKRCEKEAGTDPVPVKKPCNGECKADEKCEANKCVPKVVATVPNPCADVAMVADTEAKGDNSLQQGAFAAALQQYQSIYKCKPGLLQKLYLAACRSRNFPVAKNYFKLFPANKQDSMAQICMKEGNDPRGP